MKIWLLGIFLLFTRLSIAQSFFEQADQFFSKYVEDGMVDYKALRENSQDINNLVNQIAELDLSNKRVTPEFLKAFYINSYNILVIKQVVDLYPIAGPLEVSSFFNGIKHTVMGKSMTLDQLEKEVLYNQFPDPRLHFILVCAAKGCPPLASYSYKPEQLKKQIDMRTKQVLNLDWFIQVNNKEVKVSQIFDWYKQHFGNVIDFINDYRTLKIDQNARVDYYTYDWTLNLKE